MLRTLTNRLTIAKLGAVAVSGWLLACAFPLPIQFQGLEGAGAAWMALIPLLLVVRSSTPKAAFGWGLLNGLIFWLITLSWLLALRHTWGGLFMPLLGWVALAIYCALYTGLFATLLAATPNRWQLPLIAAPVIWVGTEWLRSSLFSGFPWNPLGVSQYRNIAAIQIAAIGGVYAVSALIVLLNTSLAMTVLRIYHEIRHRTPRRRRIHGELMMGLLAVAVCWSWGVRTVRKDSPDAQGPELRIAAIQPAIPQNQKWHEDFEHDIITALSEQSELALLVRPDLIVWPETATPGLLRIDPISQRLVESLTAQSDAYLLAGTLDYRQREGDDPEYLNASFLITPEGAIKSTYNKRHLVLFGEFLPFEKWIPVIKHWSPLGFSCIAGEKNQPLMQMPVRSDTEKPSLITFSTLICFEDAFPYLARRDVKRGARLLINQTNDAWFDGSAGSRQHMANAVLRSVENRVPMVRAANTGMTCFIDRFGRIRKRLHSGDIPVQGFSVDDVTTSASKMPLTRYTRSGDWLLGIPCALLTVLFALVMHWQSKAHFSMPEQFSRDRREALAKPIDSPGSQKRMPNRAIN